MKLLVVTQYFWPEDFRINDLVRSLADRGYDVEVLTGKPNYPEGVIFPGYRVWGCQQERWEHTVVHRIPLVGRGAKNAFKLGLNYLSFIFFGLLLAPWLLKGRRYDVIFVYAPSPILQAIPALFLGWLKKIPVAIWVQDLWPESLSATGYVRNSIVLNLVKSVVRLIYRNADLLLVQSRAFEPRVAAMAPGKPIIYFPNSVDPIFFDPCIARSPELRELNGGFPVMFAGNVGVGQSVEVILDAATLLLGYPDICFVVFGNGSRWEWMRNEVKSRGLKNVHLMGRFPLESMPGLMQKASALLVSLADEPIFALTVPNKMQAYMAAGRPILACLNGEGARLVTEACAGLTIAAEDGEALAAATLKLYQMPCADRQVLGANGRKYFHKHFAHEHLTDQLVGHLQALCEEGVD